MNQKTLDHLYLASLSGSTNWQTFYDSLCVVYGEKVVCKKMESLDRKGYIECGVSARTGWLTEKGKKFLKKQLESSSA